MANWVFLVISSQKSTLPSGSRPQVLEIPLLVLLPLLYPFFPPFYTSSTLTLTPTLPLSPAISPSSIHTLQANLYISPSLLPPSSAALIPRLHLSFPTPRRNNHLADSSSLAWDDGCCWVFLSVLKDHYKSKALNLRIPPFGAPYSPLNHFLYFSKQ